MNNPPRVYTPRKYSGEEVSTVIESIKQSMPDTWAAFLDVELGKSKVTQEEYHVLLRPMFALFKEHNLIDSVIDYSGLLMEIRTRVRE